MFVVDDILISDDVLDAPFSCALHACHGACCVQGESGAPLEPEERQRLEEALPVVWDDLRPEARAVIEREGAWETLGSSPAGEEEAGDGRYATTCVNGAECVFVTYDGPIASCALQKAHQAGRLDFRKPISCHLFPLRIQDYGTHEVLNYEQIDLCAPGRRCGSRTDTHLVDFLREPLTRKYGEAWYARFRETVAERQRVLHGDEAGSTL